MPGFTRAELEARGADWTAREILQQPAVWREVAALVERHRVRLENFLTPLLANPAVRIVLSGAGTSAFVGDCLAPALAARQGHRCDAIATTDIVGGPQRHLQRDVATLLVSFARSGNSPESAATVDLAEHLLPDVHHLIVTCNAEGALALRARGLRHAEVLLLPEATNDRGFAMTSSFTSMLLAAGLIFGAVRSESVGALAQSAEALLPAAWDLAERLVRKDFQRVVYLGSNELRGLASEAALKMLELTDGQKIAVAESTLGFRHGPKTIINGQTLVVLMLANDPRARAYDNDLLDELRRDGRAGAIVALDAQAQSQGTVERLQLPGAADASDLVLALLHVIVAQCFALRQSLSLGLSPDRPNRSGVVNRIVQGVTIHPWRA